MYDIDEMLKGVKDKLREYYLERNIDEDQWMKDIILKMVDRLGTTESTAQKNVDAPTRNPQNFKELCCASGLSGDYLLGLSPKKHIADLVTYEDAFRFVKHMVDQRMIYEYEAPDENTYYRLRKDLEDVLLSLKELHGVIWQRHPEKPEAFKAVERAWIDVEKTLFIGATCIKPDREKMKEAMKLSLGKQLHKQMAFHNIGNKDLCNKYDDFLHENFTLNEKIGENNISKYLNYNTTMPLKHVIGLSMYFGTTVDHFLGLDTVDDEKANKAVLFDVLIGMYNMDGILESKPFSLTGYTNAREDQYDFEIVYLKNIFLYFCKEYMSACKSAANFADVLSDEKLAKMKEEKFKTIVEGFTMPIKPIYKCDESTHRGCLIWLNTHSNGQTYEDYVKENSKEENSKEVFEPFESFESYLP